jgi:hypothetical protein
MEVVYNMLVECGIQLKLLRLIKLCRPEHCSSVRWLRVFENGVLRRNCGSKGDEVTGVWRKLHNEKLNDLYASPNVIWMKK